MLVRVGREGKSFLPLGCSAGLFRIGSSQIKGWGTVETTKTPVWDVCHAP